MTPARREALGLAVATGIHLGLFALSSHRAAEVSSDRRYAEAPLEVEVEAEAAPQPPPEPAQDVHQQLAKSFLAKQETTVPRVAQPGAEEPRPAESAAPASSGEFVFNPTSPGARPALSDQALGLGGRNIFLGTTGASAESPPRDEAPRNVAPGIDTSLRDALDARDHELGLDVGGPILAIAEELTRPSDTPTNGRAVFEVLIDGEGHVGPVHLVESAADGRGEWESLAERLGSTLRARRIQWRHRGHAVAVRFEVTSAWALPSGAPGGQPIGAPVVKPTTDSITATAGFDVSDIGARPTRQVHARILSEKRF